MEVSRSGSTSTEAAEAGADERLLLGLRVLLAEDDDATRKIMAIALRAMGAEVIETHDGGRMLVAIALHYKEGRSPADLDLIVTDVQMPVVGGLDVFQGLRAAGWTTPVIVVTGYETPDVRDAAERLGAVLLSKPLDLKQFEEAFRMLAARRPPAASGHVPKVTGR